MRRIPIQYAPARRRRPLERNVNLSNCQHKRLYTKQRQPQIRVLAIGAYHKFAIVNRARQCMRDSGLELSAQFNVV